MFQGLGFLKFFRKTRWLENGFRPPEYQSHRGYRGNGAPENTLPALREAARLGARMAEFDVRLSKDGVPVLHHDADLKRMHGISRKVASMTATELRALGVDTLEDVLSAKDVPEYLNIEIKSTAEAWTNPGAQEARVADVIRRTRSQDRVLISCFHPMVLFSLGHVLPEVARAYLYGSVSESRAVSQLALLPLLKVHMLNLDRNLLDERWLRELGDFEIPYCVWTVNEVEEARFFLRRGAMSVISDQNLSGLL